MRILLLGWVTNMDKIVSLFENEGTETIIVNTEPTKFFEKVPYSKKSPVALNLYQGSKIPKPKYTRFLFAFVPNTLGFQFSQKLEILIKNLKPDIIFAHYGVGVLPEIALIKGNPQLAQIPVVLNMETFPNANSRGLREMFEVSMFKRSSSFIDGFVIPTPEMADLIFKLVPKVREKRLFIKPMFNPQNYAPSRKLPKLSKQDGFPHIVFIGQFDFSLPINDVRGQLLSFAEAGIKVHCVQVNGLEHPNVIFFEPFNADALTNGNLTSFMTQFDACLVTYNYKRTPLRFKTSLPARFLTALTAGIPIIIPRGKFTAVENFVLREQIGFAYSSPQEFLSIYSSPTWQEIVETTESKREKFVVDFYEISAFLQNVLRQ